MHNYLEMKRHLLKKAYQTQTPIVGEFEITSRCNFHCQMCYLPDEPQLHSTTFEQWKTVFDEAIESGLLFALLTGGESLIHPDFVRIYDYLFDKGVKITFFSNGSFLTDEILSLLETKKPELFAITLYGADNATYHEITGVPKSFSKVEENILTLKQHSIPVLVRTIPLRPILLSLDKMIDKAKEWGLPLGYFLYVHEPYPMNLKLNPSEIRQFEQIIRRSYPLPQELPPKGFRECGALYNSYYVSADLTIRPCALAISPQSKYEPGKLLETISSMRKEWDLMDIGHCSTCSVSNSCIACKARLQLESARQTCTPYLKQIATIRKASLE